MTDRGFYDTFGAMQVSELTASRIGNALRTSLVGRPVHYFSSVDSTMTRAGQLAEEGAAEGTMVIADQQTAGRGRLRRGWWAPAGTSLLLSLIFRPPLLPSQAQRLTMICSLSVCEAIERVSGVRAQVKWPNDVLVGERKLCGILTELGIQGSQLDFAVVGIGINVNLDLRDAPSFLAPATSLLQETGRPVSRLSLLSALLGHIERRYLALRQGRSSHTEWADRLATLGHEVQVTSGAEQHIGLAVGVDQDGALLLRLEDGQQRRVLAGDVTLRSTSGPEGQE